jgi:hypothetical protein
VKLRFGPLVFLHGTPKVESLGTAASHACVRMANVDAIELARLVQGLSAPDFTTITFDSLVSDQTRTRVVPLDRPVPLRVRYDVAEVRGDSLFIHPDVYRRTRSVSEEVLRALASHGVAPGPVQRAALADLVRRSRTATVAIRLDALTADPTSDASSGLGGAR